MSLDELTERLPTLPPTIFATIGAADLLAYWDGIFAESHPTQWQWRITDRERRAYKTNIRSHSRRVDIAVQFFGFKKDNNRGYHKLIDPVTMYQERIDKIAPGNKLQIIRVHRWATTLRSWCAVNNLEVKPTMGGISNQLLTDPRFYSGARRKVPAFTNELAREHLPGQHYRLYVIPSSDRDYRAIYIDQRRAHHYHAAQIHFPHADHLYAYGHFRSLDGYYREQPSPRFMGLYCLDLLAPRFGGHHSWLGRELTYRFVHTNELPHLLDMGYSIIGIRAAWGATHRDTGLNKLATWAMEQLDQYHDPAWLKPILLSTYGALACRPTDGETMFRLAKGGKNRTVLTGRRALTGKQISRRKLEPRFANVLQRGMIEAATRSESIGLAQYLEHQGHRILSIYADAVIVEADDDRPPTLLPEPWRVKRELNHYQPIHTQAFISDGMTRLPGVGSELKQYRQATPGVAPMRVRYQVPTGEKVFSKI